MSLLAAVDGATPILPPVRTGSVLWFGPYLNQSGYGEEARGFLGPLQQAGWSICARSSGDESVDFAGSLQGSPFEASLAQALALQPVDPVIAVIHLPGSSAQPVGGAARTVMRTMFETDGLPRGWTRVLNSVDEIWVPSAFNVETFRRAGVTVPLHVVPGGVDTERFRPDVAPLAVPGARGRVYLSVFEWSHRKAPDVLLRAWAAAFGPGDPVSLVLRCFPRERFEGNTTTAVEALVDEELARIGRSRADVAPIVCVGESLPPGTMPRLMAAADVYLGVARGEGWGRPLLEAMATGLAVVGTRWSGNLAFMDDDNSLLVDVERLVEIDERMDLAFYRGQRWAEPSVEHLVDILRRTADDQGLVEAVGARARLDADERWRWTHAAGAAGARLEALSASLGEPPGERAHAGVTATTTTGDPAPAAGETGAGATGTGAGVAELHQLTALALEGLHQVVSQLAGAVAELQRHVPIFSASSLPLPAELIVAQPDGRPAIGYVDGPTAPGYRGFEDIFRGSEELIRQRQRYYLPYLVDRAPVLDVGAGRGEMLELLRQAGVPAIGVDTDATMAERARQKGLDVRCADAVEVLSALDPGGVGAVFSAQVVEHLDHGALDAMLQAVRRALAPDGLFIAETVNPHCPAARKNFWLDPTHRTPIFPEVAVSLCRQAGFASATVVFPGGTGDLATDLLTAPDYAVVARR